MNNPGRFELRNDGAFWSTQSPGASIRAVKAWGRTYVVQRSIGGTGTYYSTSPGQKTRPGGSLSSAWQARSAKKWLLANESPKSLNWTLASTAAVEIASIPGLSGYLLAKGALVETVPFDATTSDTVGSMFLRFRWASAVICTTSILHAGRGGVSVVQQQRPAACRDRSQPGVWPNTVTIDPGSGPVVPGSCCVDGDDLGSERLEVVRRRVVDGGLRR